MDWLAFSLGLGGLVATLLASGLGLYFTHKARSSPFQEHLYTKQIEVLTELSDVIHHVQYASGFVVGSDESEVREGAFQHLDTQMERLARLVHIAGVIMPAKLYQSMTSFRAAAIEFHELAEKTDPIETDYYKLMGIGVRLGILAREFVGADNLTQETINLYGKEEVEKIDSIAPEDMTLFSKTYWAMAEKFRK